MLVTMKEILQDSAKADYGVAAPCVHNEDTMRAAVAAALECNTPLILNISYDSNIVFMGRLCEDIARQVSIPVAVNLDHGLDYNQVMWAFRAGFSSVMVDRSSLPFEENVRQVKELTEIAHLYGLSVEAELGHVGDATVYDQDRDPGLTHPDEAAEFVERTGIDCLAVAIGTAHGLYSGTPHIDFDLLSVLRDAVDVPLVLHGGSGTGDENLARAAREGITKINLATDLYNAAWEKAVAEGAEEAYMGYRYLIEGYKEKLVHYMHVFNQIDVADNYIGSKIGYDKFHVVTTADLM